MEDEKPITSVGEDEFKRCKNGGPFAVNPSLPSLLFSFLFSSKERKMDAVHKPTTSPGFGGVKRGAKLANQAGFANARVEAVVAQRGRGGICTPNSISSPGAKMASQTAVWGGPWTPTPGEEQIRGVAKSPNRVQN